MLKKIAGALLSAALVSPVIFGTSSAFAQTSESTAPLPIEYWAVRSAMSNVAVSPNGKYVSFMKIQGKDADPVIEIHEIDSLGKDPIRLDATKMEFVAVNWVGDDYLLITARQQVRRFIEDVNRGTYESRVIAYNVKEKEWIELANNDFGAVAIASLLTDEPDSILIQTFSTPVEGLANASFFRADYYKYDLKTGRRTTVLRGTDKNSQAEFDAKGRPRFSQGYDTVSKDYVYYYRGKEDSSWKEIYRLPSYGYDEELQFVGISKQDENIVYAIAFNGEDRSALWAFDTNKGAFIEKVYQRPDVDILAVVDSHNVWEKSDSDDDKTGPDIVGVVYGTDRYHIDWFDAEEKAEWKKYLVEVTNYERDVHSYRNYLMKKKTIDSLPESKPLLRERYEMALRYETLLSKYETTKDIYDTQVKKLEKIKAAHEGYKRGSAALKDARKEVKRYLVPSLSKVASQLLVEMTDGQRRHIFIDENFDIWVDNQPVRTLSGSGVSVVNLALRVALGRVLTQSVIPIFLADEIDANMADKRTEATHASLRRLTAQLKQIIVVTHKEFKESDQTVWIT